VVVKEKMFVFHLSQSYDHQLKVFHKKNFDPFRRGLRIIYAFADESPSFVTTIAQLNFFQWAIQYGVIEFIQRNHAAILQDCRLQKAIKRASKAESLASIVDDDHPSNNNRQKPSRQSVKHRPKTNNIPPIIKQERPPPLLMTGGAQMYLPQIMSGLMSLKLDDFSIGSSSIDHKIVDKASSRKKKLFALDDSTKKCFDNNNNVSFSDLLV